MIGINVVVNSKTMKTTWTSSQKFCEGRQKYVISNLKMEILNVRIKMSVITLRNIVIISRLIFENIREKNHTFVIFVRKILIVKTAARNPC